MKTMTSIALLALFSFPARGVPGDEPELQNPQLERVRDLYSAEAWPEGDTYEGLLLSDLALPGLVGRAVTSPCGIVELAFAPAEAPEARAALLVDVLVTDHAASAQEQLIAWMSIDASSEPASEDSLFGFELGQAGYVRPVSLGSDVASWVAFVEGNLAVRLRNVGHGAALDLPALAWEVDRRILGGRVVAEGEPLPRPQIHLQSATNTRARAGAKVPIELGVSDPFGTIAALSWTVAGDGQGYVEWRDGRWYFFSTGPGEVQVTATVVGSSATVASATIELAIDPE